MSKTIVTLRQRVRAAAAEALLDSAEQAMLAHGYDRATMADIADAAGCATGTFYLYFKNKEELFDAIVSRHAQGMFDEGFAVLNRPGDAMERVRGGVEAFLRYSLDHRAFFRLFFTAVPVRQRAMHQQMSTTARDLRSEYMSKELDLLKEAQKRGQVRRDLPAPVLQQFMESVCFSFVEQFAFGEGTQSLPEAMRIIWGLMSGGLGAKERA